MPTYDVAAQFWRDFDQLEWFQRDSFIAAQRRFTQDLRAGQGFRKGLRVKGVKGRRGVYEMTWAPDGRATFEYGRPQRDGEPHVVWRRIGTHAILRRP
jgi:hypothetical protein